MKGGVQCSNPEEAIKVSKFSRKWLLHSRQRLAWHVTKVQWEHQGGRDRPDCKGNGTIAIASPGKAAAACATVFDGVDMGRAELRLNCLLKDGLNVIALVVGSFAVAVAGIEIAAEGFWVFLVEPGVQCSTFKRPKVRATSNYQSSRALSARHALEISRDHSLRGWNICSWIFQVFLFCASNHRGKNYSL